MTSRRSDRFEKKWGDGRVVHQVVVGSTGKRPRVSVERDKGEQAGIVFVEWKMDSPTTPIIRVPIKSLAVKKIKIKIRR